MAVNTDQNADSEQWLVSPNSQGQQTGYPRSSSAANTGKHSEQLLISPNPQDRQTGYLRSPPLTDRRANVGHLFGLPSQGQQPASVGGSSPYRIKQRSSRLRISRTRQAQKKESPRDSSTNIRDSSEESVDSTALQAQPQSNIRPYSWIRGPDNLETPEISSTSRAHKKAQNKKSLPISSQKVSSHSPISPTSPIEQEPELTTQQSFNPRNSIELASIAPHLQARRQARLRSATSTRANRSVNILDEYPIGRRYSSTSLEAPQTRVRSTLFQRARNLLGPGRKVQARKRRSRTLPSRQHRPKAQRRGYTKRKTSRPVSRSKSQPSRTFNSRSPYPNIPHVMKKNSSAAKRSFNPFKSRHAPKNQSHNSSLPQASEESKIDRPSSSKGFLHVFRRLRSRKNISPSSPPLRPPTGKQVLSIEREQILIFYCIVVAARNGMGGGLEISPFLGQPRGIGPEPKGGKGGKKALWPQSGATQENENVPDEGKEVEWGQKEEGGGAKGKMTARGRLESYA